MIRATVFQGLLGSSSSRIFFVVVVTLTLPICVATLYYKLSAPLCCCCLQYIMLLYDTTQNDVPFFRSNVFYKTLQSIIVHNQCCWHIQINLQIICFVCICFVKSNQWYLQNQFVQEWINIIYIYPIIWSLIHYAFITFLHTINSQTKKILKRQQKNTENLMTFFKIC